jgi:ribosomal protein L40E
MGNDRPRQQERPKVDCPRCDALVPPRAEFCPQCGTPTSPGLRERLAAPRTDDDLKRNRRNVFIIGAAFVFGLAILGQASWFDNGFDFDSDDPQRRPAVIAAQPLFEAYRDDADEAEDRFEDRYLVVTGEFVRVVPDNEGDPDLRLRTSDPELPLGVDLIGSSHREAARLRPGQRVTVSCERVVRGPEDNWLQNCSIETVAEGSEAPSAVPAGGTPAEAEGAAATPE